MNFRLLYLVVFLVLIASQAKAMRVDNFVCPPDSTTNLIDKSTAIIMLEEGKRIYAEGKVHDALNQFRLVATKDPHSWRPIFWIGRCHYAMSNYGFALKYANEALKINSHDIDNEVYVLIGEVYHHMEKLDSAIINYEKALAKLPYHRVKELGLAAKIEQCKYAQTILATGQKTKRVRMQGKINSSYNEYAPILSYDGKMMYFTSRRKDTKGGKANPDDQEYFEDVYRAIWNNEAQQWDSITNEIDRINSDGFDSFSFLSKDGLVALMTINTSAINVKNATKSSDLFEVDFSNKGKWSSPKSVFNSSINTSFFEGSPTMTADGNTMYFVSDRKGDKKSTDIYVAHKTGKTWGEAEPLSDVINTTEAETTPFISEDGRYLFFSSEGHLGMGGFDIFVSENLGGTWSKPINLGGVVNTVNNDTHFKYYPELKKAVMAGIEIMGQKSSFDLFDVDMTDFEFPKQ